MKYTILFLLFSLSVSAQDVKTRIIRYEVKDTTWKVLSDTVVSGEQYYKAYGTALIDAVTNNFKLKQVDKKGHTLTSTFVKCPYESQYIADTRGASTPTVVEVRCAYKPEAVAFEISRYGNLDGHVKWWEHKRLPLKQYE